MLLSAFLYECREIWCILRRTKVDLQLFRMRFSQFPQSPICILSMSITLRFLVICTSTPDRVIIDSCVTVRVFERQTYRLEFTRRVMHRTVVSQRGACIHHERSDESRCGSADLSGRVNNRLTARPLRPPIRKAYLKTLGRFEKSMVFEMLCH
jgi:hypothetical protein